MLRISVSTLGLLAAALLSPRTAATQQRVPPDVAVLNARDLRASRQALSALGYETVSSGDRQRMQYFWHDSSRICVALAHDGRRVTRTVRLKDTECMTRLAAPGSSWDAYRDGPSTLSSPALARERDKLRSLGFVPTYWTKDIAPGRSSEYWWNDGAGQCRSIVAETQGGAVVKVQECDPQHARNPAPKPNH